MLNGCTDDAPIPETTLTYTYVYRSWNLGCFPAPLVTPDSQTRSLPCRYNARISEEADKDELQPAQSPSAMDVRQISLAKAPLSPLPGPLQSLGHLHKPGTEDDMKPITHWVIADVASQVMPACHLQTACAAIAPFYKCLGGCCTIRPGFQACGRLSGEAGRPPA